ncbi:hypothetical protein FHX35_001944 [Auritidibacter ignavus]|nr:hypothetical protein [Auritidibacter ignavus]
MELFFYIILSILTISVLWSATELHLLRRRIDTTVDRARRRQQRSPKLFDQETQ